MGPRPPPGTNKSEHFLTSTTKPLSINKRPKLKLSPINTAEVAGDEHSYYNIGQPPSSQAHGITVPDDNSDSSRTLRPPMANDPSSIRVNEIRDAITEIEQRSESRMSKRSSGPADHTSSSSPVSIQQSSTNTSNNTSATGSNGGDKGWENERWSDDAFQVVSRLGEGAGGAVYKVKDKRTGDLYARKTIPTRTTPAKQLLAELKHLSNTKHSNICEFYGAYMSSSSSEVNVVMELCDGGSLEAIMRKLKEREGRVGEQLIGKLAEGILSGLVHLHSLRIIHRDIKPSNILLTLSGIIKLCDFGVSGELQDSIVVTFLGTSWYMAPERVNGKPYTVRADVWSTGLCLLELALNRFPLPDDLDGIIPLMDYITRGPPILLVDDATVKWSDGAKEFIALCLRVSDTDRPHPKQLLSHPWLMDCCSTVSNRHVSNWVRDVWGIPRIKRPATTTPAAS